MSIHSVLNYRESVNPNFTRSFRPIGMLAGIGLLLIMPGKTEAEHRDRIYGHAEITVGFPNGHVTVGKTWENHPREVVVEEVTHRYPDYDDDDDDEYDDAERVIIEKRGKPCRKKKVVIIERIEEPRHCDRREVVRRVYVKPRCRPTEVVVYREPAHRIHRHQERVIYAPSHHDRPALDHGHRGSQKVIVVPPSGGSYHHNDGSSRPRDLFPEEGGRPMRSRGVQRTVAMGGG